MSKKMAKFLSVLLLALAVAVTQVPVSDAEAVAPASDFQVEGNKLLKYAGSAEAVTIPEGIKEIGEEVRWRKSATGPLRTVRIYALSMWAIP